MKQKSKENRLLEGCNPVISEKENNLKNSFRLKSSSFLVGLTLTVVFVVFSADVNAQFQWGPKLGVNTSTQSELGNIFDNDGLKVGYNAGIMARYQLNDWLALKSGLDYKLVGSKNNVSGEDTKLEYKMDYLSLPLKAEFSASEKAGFKNGQRLFFATGPYCGYLLNAEQKFQGEATDIEDLEDFDYGWSFELGFEFPVAENNAIQLSVDYDMGLRNISDESNVKNKSASLNLGFLF